MIMTFLYCNVKMGNILLQPRLVPIYYKYIFHLILLIKKIDSSINRTIIKLLKYDFAQTVPSRYSVSRLEIIEIGLKVFKSADTQKLIRKEFASPASLLKVCNRCYDHLDS